MRAPDGYGPRKVVFAYLAIGLMFTLAASLIWAINTIFLIREGGLTIFDVMVVNAVYTVSQMVFEVPTGVIADTIGRKASLALCMIVLIISTVLYAITPQMGWGIWGFVWASVLIGLGYTFQTGAMDAWLVDALDETGWDRPKDKVFAWGQMCFGIGMLVGSVLGGFLGQSSLVLPYMVRAALLVIALVLALTLVKDLGFERRPLRLSNFAAETRTIFDAGVHFGWRSPVVRPLFWVSAFGGVFFMYGFYAWQPYVLELLGRPDAIWLLGIVQAGFSCAGIFGNMLVGRVMGEGESRREPARVLELATWVTAALTFAIAGVGLAGLVPGVLAAGIAITLWVLWGALFGLITPVRMAYINDNIPSPQRATVLSLDAFFGDAGAAVGQPALGWISTRLSIPVAWVVGGVFMAISALFYRSSGTAARAAAAARGEGLEEE